MLVRSPKVSRLVMIVDDHAVIRRMVCEAFEAEDLLVSVAGTERKACRRHKS